MTTGMALDYITEHLDMKDPNKKSKEKSRIRMANQADFDKF